MQKTIAFLVIFLVLLACKRGDGQNVTDQIAETDFNTKEWPKRVIANSKADEILNEWEEYVSFETSFEGIYRIENNEDLVLVIEDLIEKQKLLIESEYPETFDKPQIKGRQVVLKTYILKTKGKIEYRLDTQETVIEMINAFNALRNQFNVIINSTLDTKLIFDE